MSTDIGGFLYIAIKSTSYESWPEIRGLKTTCYRRLKKNFNYRRGEENSIRKNKSFKG